MSRTPYVLAGCLLCLLSLSIAGSVGITMRLNYLYVVSMVTDAEKKLLLGWGSVIADLWKASGLIFVPLLWRRKLYPTAAAAALVWVLCFVLAVASLLGSVAQVRMTATGGRETMHASYGDVEKELGEVEATRKVLRSARPPDTPRTCGRNAGDDSSGNCQRAAGCGRDGNERSHPHGGRAEPLLRTQRIAPNATSEPLDPPALPTIITILP